MPLPTTGLEVLHEAECRCLLQSATVGRVVLSVNALPAAFPVAYRLRGAVIVLRAGPGTRLTRAMEATVVGFEVDHVDVSTATGWSVLAIGIATVVSDEDEIAALEHPQVPSLAGDRLPRFVQITIDTICGRRIPAWTP